VPRAVFTNQARTTLSAGINNSVTSIAVVDGSVFPTPTDNNYAYLTIEEGLTSEVVQLTARSGNTLTVVRARDGTAGATFTSAATVSLRLPRIVLDEIWEGIKGRITQALTYAALTAIPAAERVDNQVVYVTSRSADGDGGEGYWRFDSASSATANAGTILAPDAGSGRWLRQYAGALNVMWFGATGLDATPNQSTAIFAAVAAATAAGGGVVLFPDGVYRFKNLRPSSNTSLEAINPGKVTWKFPTSGTIAVTDYILYNATPGSYSDVNLSVSGVIVDGENVNSGFNQSRFDALLNFGRVTGLTLKQVTVKNNEYIGLAIAGCRRVVLDRPEAEACGFKGGTGTFTVTIASPAVFTRAAHGFSNNLGVKFSTTGALPTGLLVGKTYYVKNATTNTFEVSAVGGYLPLGVSVDTSGTQSGTHTLQTVSSNGGPAIWIANSGSDQSTDVEVYAPHVRDCVWTGMHINATGTKVVGGVIDTCREAGVFAPNVPGGNILCNDIAFIGLTVRDITRTDISASGFEVGASNAKFVDCHIENVGASGISLLDNDTVTVTGCTIKNFNKDQIGATHQGPGILVLSLTAGNIARNITITGNTITDDQGSPTGYAGITVTGVAESPENIIIQGNVIDDIAWGNPTATDILISRAGPGCKIQGNSNAEVRGNASAQTMGGRLTLTSGQPVTTADVTAATAVYYTAYVHDVFWTWDGTAFVPNTFTQLGLTFTSNSAHENYQQADKNFDVFLFLDENSQGQLLGTGPAWTSDTARGTGAGTTELEYHKGVWVNKVSMRLRWGSASGNIGTVSARNATYVGTIRMTADGQTEDSLVKRFVWNTHNRRNRAMQRIESTANWTYSTATFRQANNNTANQLAMVRGLNEDCVYVEAVARVSTSSAAVANAVTDLGLDVTNNKVSGTVRSQTTPDNAFQQLGQSSRWTGYPGLGYHFIAWLEIGDPSLGATQTWYAGNAQGIHGVVIA
jgi:hypothetical protein